MAKYYDTTAVLQVIGCVFNDPTLLDMDDKYLVTEEDFSNEFHKIVYGAIYKIHELGAKIITLQNINDFLSSKPKSLGVYQAEKGEEWLLKVSENANNLTFDYYYNRLKKMTLLRAYDRYGIDVSDIYDYDNILDVKKKEMQEQFLDNSTLIELADKIDEKIENIRYKYVDQGYGEASPAGKGIFELIQGFKDHPEIGVPLYGPFVNAITRGARLKKFYLRSAATGIGKRIPDYTLIPTPQGWRKVGDIQIGDILFGQNGKPTKVLNTFKGNEEIWKITFSDGRIAECCGEHLWEYRYKSHRGYEYRVEDCQTIYKRSLELKNGLKNSSGKGYRFHIRLNDPVEYPEKIFSIDPYVMGLLLGDGTFRQWDISFSSQNDELPSKISEIIKCQYHKVSAENYAYYFTTEDNHHLKTADFLKEYPELINTKSETKFIPIDYLQGSIKQRFDLLCGLLDTDGSIDSRGHISYTTISPYLKDNIIELCRSLGMIASYYVDKRDKYSTGKCYKIIIQAKKSIKPKMFKLSYKQKIAQDYANSNKREEYKDHLAIINIEKTTSKTNMTCFEVDNENHLFLMNDYIVTHNTRSMIADCCYIGCNKIYDDTFGWIKTGAAQPTLFITTEQELGEIQTMMLAFLSGVNEEHIINNFYEGDEDERVQEAANILKDSPIFIEELPDFSLQDVENTIKRNLRDHNIKYVFHDYIHTSIKILEEITRRSGGVRLREDNILFMLSTKLKDICNQYGVFIMSATQLNADYTTSETPDQNLLRGAKAIADKIDYGAILLQTTQADIDALEPILQANVFDRPSIKMSVYKNRRGRYKGVYLWCKADLGTCRIQPMFCTTYNYDLINIDDIKILVEEEGAF